MSETLDLQTLRVVLAVADCGSISAGSQQADLALAAASARITALESALGLALFERGPRGVRLTPDGHAFVQRARLLVADADRLAGDMRDRAAGLQGSLRVLANASAMLEWLPERLARFGRSHPRIHVELEERSSPDIPLALLEGRADLGIVDLLHPLQGLAFSDLFRDTLVAVLSRGHALATEPALRFEQLLGEAFVSLTDGNAISGRLGAAALELGRPLRVRLQMRSFDAVCRMVAAGLGVGVLPVQAITPQLGALAIVGVPLSDRWAQRTHRLATRAGATPSPALTALLAALRDEVD